MAGTLNVKTVFGVKGNVRNNVHFVEDSVVVYPAGSFLVKTHTGTRQQEFLPCSEGAAGVTAMSLSHNRRYMAVAERNEGPLGALLSVYNLRTLTKRKAMTAAPHLRGAVEFVSVCFNLDDSLLLALSGAPGWQLAVFSVDRGRCVSVGDAVTPQALLIASEGPAAPLPIGCSFSSVSLSKAVAYGRNLLTFYSVDERTLSPEDATALEEPAPAPDSPAAAVGGAGAGAEGAAAGADDAAAAGGAGAAGPRASTPGGGAAGSGAGVLTHNLTALQQNGAFVSRAMAAGGSGSPATDYTAQVWLGDDLSVVASAAGELLLFKRDQFVRVMGGESPLDGRVIDVMVAFSRGFITGGEGGSLRIYEYASPDDTSRFNCTRTFRANLAPVAGGAIDCEERIRSISISPSEETAALALSGCQLLAFDLGRANVKDDTNAFSPLGPASHGPPPGHGCGPGFRSDTTAVLSMDVAARKPLMATVGVDNSVRVWNFADRGMEVCKTFPEGPTSVALHPSGLQVVVGFVDKLRLLNVLMDDLREVKEFAIKACAEVRFSNGGHCFAAANGAIVQLYSTYRGEYQQSLRGHNGRVTGLQWAPNDATLLTCSADGSIYEWDVAESKRTREFILKGVRWQGVSASKDGSLVYAVGDGAGTDGLQHAIREIDMSSGTITREVVSTAPLGAVMLTLASPRMLFAATAAEGQAGSVRSFHMPLMETAIFNEYPASSGPIVRMVASRDDAFLFVAGADGSAVAYEVRDKDGRLPASEFGVKVGWADEILVTVSDLDDKKAAVRDLRDQVAELQSANDYTLRMKDIAFQEQLKKVTERSTAELEAERQQYDLLREEKLDLERASSEHLNSMEIAHRSEMQKRESLYQGKIMEEVERFQGLQSDVEAQRAMWGNRRAAMVASHMAFLQQLTSDYERRLEAARDRRHELQEEVEGVQRDWDEMRRQMEEDLDKEVEGMRRGYVEKLDAERDATLKFKGENGIMMKKFSALSKEMDEIGEEIRRMNDKQRSLRAQITELEKEISVLRLLSQEKDVAIAEKEKRIYELKKKNQELEKFKFVLDYKIKELKQQIEPRENEIAAMKRQIREVDAELEAYHTSNAELDELVGKLRTQLNGLQASGGTLRTTLHRRHNAMKEFLSVLHDVMHTAARQPDALHSLVARLAATNAARFGMPPSAAPAGGSAVSGTGSSPSKSRGTGFAAGGAGSPHVRPGALLGPGPAGLGGAMGGGAGGAGGITLGGPTPGGAGGASIAASFVTSGGVSAGALADEDEEDAEAAGTHAAIIAESTRQCENLSALVARLKKRAAEESAGHRRAGAQLVSDNMALIEQIKALREQVSALRLAQKCWNIDRPRAVAAMAAAKLNSLLPPGIGDKSGGGGASGTPSRIGTRTGTRGPASPTAAAGGSGSHSHASGAGSGGAGGVMMMDPAAAAAALLASGRSAGAGGAGGGAAGFSVRAVSGAHAALTGALSAQGSTASVASAALSADSVTLAAATLGGPGMGLVTGRPPASRTASRAGTAAGTPAASRAGTAGPGGSRPVASAGAAGAGAGGAGAMGEDLSVVGAGRGSSRGGLMGGSVSLHGSVVSAQPSLQGPPSRGGPDSASGSSSRRPLSSRHLHTGTPQPGMVGPAGSEVLPSDFDGGLGMGAGSRAPSRGGGANSAGLYAGISVATTSAAGSAPMTVAPLSPSNSSSNPSRAGTAAALAAAGGAFLEGSMGGSGPDGASPIALGGGMGMGVGGGGHRDGSSGTPGLDGSVMMMASEAAHSYRGGGAGSAPPPPLGVGGHDDGSSGEHHHDVAGGSGGDGYGDGMHGGGGGGMMLHPDGMHGGGGAPGAGLDSWPASARPGSSGVHSARVGGGFPASSRTGSAAGGRLRLGSAGGPRATGSAGGPGMGPLDLGHGGAGMGGEGADMGLTITSSRSARAASPGPAASP